MLLNDDRVKSIFSFILWCLVRVNYLALIKSFTAAFINNYYLLLYFKFKIINENDIRDGIIEKMTGGDV